MKSRRPETPTSEISRPAESRESSSIGRTTSSPVSVFESTSRARSVSGEIPPLAYSDVEPLLAIADLPPEVVLVGGQALNFWADYYADRVPEIRAQEPLTSRDIDFVGPEYAARGCAARLCGQVEFADIDHATANYAVVRFRDKNGNERLVDFLERICGVEPKDLQRTALRVEPLDTALKRSGVHFTVMHPVVCMESRISNSVEFQKYQGKHGLLQARMSVLCAKAFVLDLLDHGDLRAVSKLNERIFRFAKSNRGRDAVARFQIEPFAAVVVDDRLPVDFRTIRYPQMQRDLNRLLRGRRHGGLSP